MPLLDFPATAHAPAVNLFAQRLRAGDEQDRALLMNLQEEDRVSDGRRTAFHAALAGSRQLDRKEQFKEAAPVAQRALPVPVPRPSSVAGTWCHHVGFGALQRYKYVSPALQRVARPPPRIPLARPIGQREDGSSAPFWITSATSTNADDIRNRLGLCLIISGEHLCRITIGVDRAPGRALFIPSAVDAGFYPAWRHPGPGHTDPWGRTRHLETDAVSERELLTLPDAADDLVADYIGLVSTDPPRGYLVARGIA